MSKNSVDINTLINTYNGYYTNEQGDPIQDAANSINMNYNREKAGQALTQHALRIPMNQINYYKPNESALRNQQIETLFRLYQNGNALGNNWRKINERNTVWAEIRQYVLNSNKNFTDFVLSQDDITAIARVSLASKEMVKEVKSGKQIEGMSIRDDRISMSQVKASVDNLVGIANVIRAQVGQPNVSLSQILPPEVTETVVKGVVAERVNGIDSFEALSKDQRTGFLANVRNVISKMLGRDDRNNSDIQK